jgi:hypothetical protein
MATALDNIDGVTTVTRLGGINRYVTSQLINRDAFTASDNAYLATGLNFPDGLTGAALAGKNGAPLYTVMPNCIPFESLSDMAMLGVTDVWLMGGTGVLGTGVANLQACP